MEHLLLSSSLFLSLEYGTSMFSLLAICKKQKTKQTNKKSYFLKLGTNVLVTPTLNTFFFLCPHHMPCDTRGLLSHVSSQWRYENQKFRAGLWFILQLSSAPSSKLNKWMAFHKVSLIFPSERLNNELNDIAIWLNVIFMILRTLSFLVQIVKWISLKENNLSLCTPVMYSHK